MTKTMGWNRGALQSGCGKENRSGSAHRRDWAIRSSMNESMAYACYARLSEEDRRLVVIFRLDPENSLEELYRWAEGWQSRAFLHLIFGEPDEVDDDDAPIRVAAVNNEMERFPGWTESIPPLGPMSCRLTRTGIALID